jgi:2-methylisocitrate lyase-like PEP mutase family enzyme
VIDEDDLRRLTSEVDRPVNVVARPGCPPVLKLVELGVRRVSVGAWFAFAALGALVEAATELRDHGTFGYLDKASIGARTALPAFSGD